MITSGSIHVAANGTILFYNMAELYSIIYSKINVKSIKYTHTHTHTHTCCTQYASKFAKLSSGHRTGKGQFSFQSQRKAMPKNVQTTTQLHSSYTLVK